MQAMKKINLIKNDKKPAMAWSKGLNHFNDINMTKYNCGILTGAINNIIVVDVDEKDRGIEEFAKYTKIHGCPYTMTQTTPNKGFHYIFSFEHSKPEVKYIIQSVLTNKSKYRNGAGIDVRTTGGYIVGAPSTINGVAYVCNNASIIEMPEQLAYWLIETDKMPIIPRVIKAEDKIVKEYPQNLIYDLNDNQIVEILDALPSEYLNEISKWLAITNIMKNMNKFDLWDKWCKKSSKYDQYKNVIIWNSAKGLLNINWLMITLKKPLIASYKPVSNETTQKPNKIVSHKYVSDCITYDEFKKYNTIVVKSCTGTGKTTMTAKYVEQYLKTHSGLQVLSITNLISLGLQHIESFKKCNISLTSYDDKDLNISNDHIYSCINSLYKIMGGCDASLIKNFIVYIDEITTFIECLTHNDLLDNTIKDIYRLLIKIVKNCHKIIVSDATINNNTFELLRHRTSVFYVVNEYKKFQDVPAVQMKNENEFLEKLKDAIKKHEYFLFGSDWNGRITDLYNTLIREFEDQKDDFLLITSDTKFKVGNASEQFKNKYVFYSPSITTAIDFSIDEKQDVFIYLSGKSILPTGSYQQTTRTRNIRNLYFYSDAKPSKPMYNDYQELVKDYIDMNKTSSILNNICLSIDENDEDKMIENTYFKLYTYNEYLKDCYTSNKNIHFKNILKENGFILSSTGTKKAFSKDVLEEFKELRDDIAEELFEEYKAGNKEDPKFEQIHDRVLMLNITNEDDLETYKEVVKSKYEMENHLNVIRLLKSDDYIKNKLSNLSKTSFNVKIITTLYSKLNLLNQVMLPNNLLTVFTADDVNYDIDDAIYKIIKKTFRVERAKPTNKEEYIKLLASLIKNVADVMNIDKKTTKKTTTRNYSIDTDKLLYHINLDKLNNSNYVNYADHIKDAFELKAVELEDHYNEFLDYGIER